MPGGVVYRDGVTGLSQRLGQCLGRQAVAAPVGGLVDQQGPFEAHAVDGLVGLMDLVPLVQDPVEQKDDQARQQPGNQHSPSQHRHRAPSFPLVFLYCTTAALRRFLFFP